MVKGFIITGIPKSCFYCDYCHEREYNRNYQIEGDKFCGLENMEVNDFYSYENLRRPDWCPIRELPKKDNKNYHSDEYLSRYADGWNACLNCLEWSTND